MKKKLLSRYYGWSFRDIMTAVLLMSPFSWNPLVFGLLSGKTEFVAGRLKDKYCLPTDYPLWVSLQVFELTGDLTFTTMIWYMESSRILFGFFGHLKAEDAGRAVLIRLSPWGLLWTGIRGHRTITGWQWDKHWLKSSLLESILLSKHTSL